MPTQAEAARMAQEDAMARQAMMQAIQQRQAQDAINRAQKAVDARSANELAIAQMQIGAAKDMEASRATREERANQALMDRQLALVGAGKGMSEAERATLALQTRQADADIGLAAREKLVRQMRGESPIKPQSVHEAVTTGNVQAAKPAATPYDITGFNADVGGIAENARLVRNQTDGLQNYDDMPTLQPSSQGAFIRDPTGTLRQVHFPEASSSKTATRAQMAQRPMTTASGVDHAALQKALNMRTEAQPSQVSATTVPVEPVAPVDDGFSARDVRDAGRAALGLGSTVADKATDAEIASAQEEYASTKSPDALAFLKSQGIPVRERKLTRMDLESDPTFTSQKDVLRQAAKQRSSGWFPNLDSTNRKANFNADDALMQMYQAGIAKGFSKEEMKKLLQAELVRLNMAEDIQWGLPDTITAD